MKAVQLGRATNKHGSYQYRTNIKQIIDHMDKTNGDKSITLNCNNKNITRERGVAASVLKRGYSGSQEMVVAAARRGCTVVVKYTDIKPTSFWSMAQEGVANDVT